MICYAYDGLNRMTKSPKVGGGTHVYQHDVLGNRTWKDYGQPTVTRYQWDELGRMRGWSGGQSSAPLWGFTARYRPDGMRAQKVNGLQLGVTYTEENEVSGYFDSWATDKPTTRYYYDGQTPFAEDYLYKDSGGVDRQRTSVYVPGLRGCDGMRVSVDGTQTAVGWPIYDTHGNNVGMFEQTANDNHTVGHERRYDAWGAAVWQTGDPPQQGYVANIGHRKEPESELIYMRARYYEPSTGRFISEDPARDGWNWYRYCDNDPINKVDSSGKYAEELLKSLNAAAYLVGIGRTLIALFKVMSMSSTASLVGAAGLLGAMSWIMGGYDANSYLQIFGGTTMAAVVLAMMYGLPAAAMAEERGLGSLRTDVVGAVIAYGLVILLFIEIIALENLLQP